MPNTTENNDVYETRIFNIFFKIHFVPVANQGIERKKGKMDEIDVHKFIFFEWNGNQNVAIWRQQ